MAQAIAKRYSRSSRSTMKRKRDQLQRGARKWGKTFKIFWAEVKIWLLVMFAVLLMACVAILLFSPVFNVKQVHVRRQDPRVDIEEVQQTLVPLFQERLLFVSKAQITEMLLPRFPDIRRVEVEKSYPSTLTISLYLDPVIAELSGDDIQQQTSGTGAVATSSGAYAYVTSRGYAVFSPIKLSREKLPRLRLVDWGVRPTNRSAVMSTELLKAVFDARSTLQTDFGFPVTDVTVYLRAQEFHIGLQKVSLWFDMISPLDVQFQRFREFLRSLSLDQVKEYIDLRISDRVIYK